MDSFACSRLSFLILLSVCTCNSFVTRSPGPLMSIRSSRSIAAGRSRLTRAAPGQAARMMAGDLDVSRACVSCRRVRCDNFQCNECVRLLVNKTRWSAIDTRRCKMQFSSNM